LVARSAAMLERCEAAAQMRVEERRDFGAEGFVVLRGLEFHQPASAKCDAAMNSCSASADPSQWLDACARLKCRCASYSQVNPTPPCSWIASCAQKKWVSDASALAAAHSNTV